MAVVERWGACGLYSPPAALGMGGCRAVRSTSGHSDPTVSLRSLSTLDPCESRVGPVESARASTACTTQTVESVIIRRGRRAAGAGGERAVSKRDVRGLCTLYCVQ